MLKFLRKYNSIILVIGGSLLMVAFLLPETISQLGKSPLGGSAFKVNGSKVSYSDAEFATREHYALERIVGPIGQMMGDGWRQALGVGENANHWILLNREARRQGFVGGKEDGAEYLPNLARDVMLSLMGQFMGREQIESQAKQTSDSIARQLIPQMMGEPSLHLTEDEIYRALGKLHAVNRMRNSYFGAASGRLSGPRLIAGLKEITDSAKLDAVFVPPEREFAGLAEPKAEQMQAHFDRFKGTKPGEGEYGIGYLLPERLKLAYITIDKAAVQAGVKPGAVEVAKRFLKQFPTGTPPSAEVASAARIKIDEEVRAEQVEKVMQAIDLVVKAEFERAVRKLEAEGEYKKLPADWATQRPDFGALSAVIEKRVKESMGAQISLPAVTIKDGEWLTAKEVGELPGIGASTLRRGNQSEPFAKTVFMVRELAGRNQSGLQVGVPGIEFTSDTAGNRYYFMVLDARKESAPDAYTDIGAQVALDVKRLGAFEKLRDSAGGYRLLADTTSDGLAMVAKSGAKTAADELPIKTGLTVRENSISPEDADLNHEEFRKAVLKGAARLDPLTDVATQDLSLRTLVVPVSKSLGLAVVRITAVSPLTEERFRTTGNRAASELINRLRKQDGGPREDPFALSTMEERLKVEYNDGREKKTAEEEKKG